MGLFHRNSTDGDEKAQPPPYEGNSSSPAKYPVAKAPIPTTDLVPQSGFAAGPSTQSSFAAVLLSKSDRIRILNFPAPQPIIAALDDAIKRAWPVGIQQNGRFDSNSWEWKLSGRPWYGQGAEAIPARRLIIHILHALAAQGWFLTTSTDLTKKMYDKDTLFFKSGPPTQKFIFGISFNESDKIRIIDPPDENVKMAFDRAVRSSWPDGIQDYKTKESGCYQMKLVGRPWWTSRGETVNQTRILACNVLSAMDACGYQLYGSVDMSMSGSENQSDFGSSLARIDRREEGGKGGGPAVSPT